MRRTAIGYWLLAIGAIGSPLAGQTRDSTRLNEIIVTANRAPTPLSAVGSSADRLRPEELRRRQVRSLREALQLAPGGTVLVNGAPGGIASLFLRGVASTQTLFLVDGIRLNDADASYGSFLGGAELSGLGRLEIVRGPQSTLYGGAGIGGVVALEAEAGAGRPHAELELDAGSFATWRGALSGRGATRSGRLSGSVALSASGTDNQRHPNDWDQRTQLVRLDYQRTPLLRAGTSFRGIQHEFTSPGDLRTTNSTPAETTTFDHSLATLWIEATPLPRWRSRLLAGFSRQSNAFSGRYNGGPESVFRLRNTRRVLDWQHTITPASRLVVVAGANLESSTGVSGDERQDQRLLGFYGEAQLTPLTGLSLTAGLRADDYNTFAHATTYRFTAAYQIGSSGTTLRGSLGTGFMPPSLAARFGSGFQNPNPEIRPERSQGWDLGAEQSWSGGRGTLSVTWFHNALRDLIGFESATYPDLGHSINIDRARTSGLELGGRLLAGPLDARLAYTLLSAKSLSESDPAAARLIRRPRHTANADLLLALNSRAALGAGVLVVADREDFDFNSFPSQRVNPGDYAIARLYGSWDIGARLTLLARVENLFDQSYEPVYGFPALRRSLSGSAAVRF